MQMTWLAIAIVAAIISALCTFSDNYISDVLFKKRTPQAQGVFFGPAYLATALGLVLLLPIKGIPIFCAIGLIIAGAISSLGAIPYNIALGKDESTNVTILQQLSPIFYLILGRLILGEQIGGGQLLAFLVVLIAPTIIVLSSKRGREGKIKIIGLVLAKSILAALAGTLVVKFGKDVDYTTMLFYVMLGKGLFDVVMIFVSKKWRTRFKNARKQTKSIRFWTTLTIDHVISAASDFTYYTALILAPSVTMSAAVMKTLHPIFVFTFGVVLSILWPNFGREKVKRKVILTHLTATAIAVTGIILMQVL